ACGGVKMTLISTGGVFMPVYDYVCQDCKKTFERILTLHEHDNKEMRCPECGSKNIEQEAAAFYAVTSKKSA
ncbi:MAG TPA: zinc ribbon domain-containing protein, partial [Terriglobales bacterium]|nr:zinc ribbon domain-containing protein [Terriglobales bacterium]